MKPKRMTHQRPKTRRAPTSSAATQALATLPSPVEQALIQGDLSSLSADERVSYYRTVCRSLGLNPLTRPFDYLLLNNKLVLYARRDCTDQLRQSRNVRIEILERSEQNGLYVVRARASMPSGRSDESLGAVSVKGLVGTELANCLMRAETKAKRRVTLSICGLGMLDESELDGLAQERFKDEALKAEDVMPRRKPPEGEGIVAEIIPPQQPIQPAARSDGERRDESVPQTSVEAARERKRSPTAERAELKSAGVVTPAEPPVGQSSLPLAPPGGNVMEINGRQVITGGITKPTLLKTYKMSAQLDELVGKGQAKELLGREFGFEHRAELTEETGQKYIAALVKLVNKALQDHR